MDSFSDTAAASKSESESESESDGQPKTATATSMEHSHPAHDFECLDVDMPRARHIQCTRGKQVLSSTGRDHRAVSNNIHSWQTFLLVYINVFALDHAIL